MIRQTSGWRNCTSRRSPPRQRPPIHGRNENLQVRHRQCSTRNVERAAAKSSIRSVRRLLKSISGPSAGAASFDVFAYEADGAGIGDAGRFRRLHGRDAFPAGGRDCFCQLRQGISIGDAFAKLPAPRLAASGATASELAAAAVLFPGRRPRSGTADSSPSSATRPTGRMACNRSAMAVRKSCVR